VIGYRSGVAFLTLFLAVPGAHSESVRSCDNGEAVACSPTDQAPRPSSRSSGTIDVTGFGAKCDGRNDDTVPLRNAAAAVPPSGGILQFPKGVCTTRGTIYLKSHTHVQGDSTTLLAAVPWSAERIIQVARSSNRFAFPSSSRRAS
jgi:polygalacturonase